MLMQDWIFMKQNTNFDMGVAQGKYIAMIYSLGPKSTYTSAHSNEYISILQFCISNFQERCDGAVVEMLALHARGSWYESPWGK